MFLNSKYSKEPEKLIDLSDFEGDSNLVFLPDDVILMWQKCSDKEFFKLYKLPFYGTELAPYKTYYYDKNPYLHSGAETTII